MHLTGFAARTDLRIKAQFIPADLLPGDFFLWDNGYTHFHLLHFELRFDPAGQDTVMPDPDEFWRKYMEAKTPQKLTGIQGDHFLFALLPVVFVSKSYFAISNSFYSVIGNGNSVCISAQIFNYLTGPQKGLPGINHPMFPVKFMEQVIIRGQFIAKTISLELFHKFPSEYQTHGLYRKQIFAIVFDMFPMPGLGDTSALAISVGPCQVYRSNGATLKDAVK